MHARAIRRVWIHGIMLALGLLLVEPFLERKPPVRTLGDLQTAPQYLRVCPLAEVAHFLPAVRGVPIAYPAIAGLALALLGLVPAFRQRRWDRSRRAGVYALGLAFFLLMGEFLSKGYWQIGPVQIRYVALAVLAIGSALCTGSQGYFCALAITGFLWDGSSAVFWASLHGPGARLPVPYWGTLEAGTSGPPAWLPMIVDLGGVLLFAFLWVTRFDFFGLLTDGKGSEGRAD